MVQRHIPVWEFPSGNDSDNLHQTGAKNSEANPASLFLFVVN
ncbi:MAG: hypothetical protein PETM_01346 [Petrimonas sp.]